MRSIRNSAAAVRADYPRRRLANSTDASAYVQRWSEISWADIDLVAVTIRIESRSRDGKEREYRAFSTEKVRGVQREISRQSIASGCFEVVAYLRELAAGRVNNQGKRDGVNPIGKPAETNIQAWSSYPARV